MNKNDAIKCFIDEIYSKNTELVLSTEDIKKIGDFYKKTLTSDEEFEKYMQKYKEEFKELKKLKSGTYEIKKQYNQGKALQPGILSECNYVETLARLFGLNKCIDLDTRPINSIPVECATFFRSGKLTYSCARYLYYNPKNTNIFIFQYGNPAAGDAEIVMDGNSIRLEFKENIAKAGEYDITGLYNENGKLLISETFKEKTPELIPFIDKFNEETNIIEQLGHNYNNFDEQTKIESIYEYFLKHDIDILITSTNNDILIALTPDCLDVELSDGSKFIYTDNSEIRTSGRNYGKVFTNELFEETLTLLKATEVDSGKYKINLNQKLVEIVNARGTTKPSRVKFRNVFFVDIKNVMIDNDHVIFYRKDVKQLKPSISMHIKVSATKDMLKEYFENI